MDKSHLLAKTRYLQMLYVHMNEAVALAAKAGELELIAGDKSLAEDVYFEMADTLSAIRDDVRSELEEMGQLRAPVIEHTQIVRSLAQNNNHNHH